MPFANHTPLGHHEKNCSLVRVSIQKKLLQKEEMCLLDADHGKAFLLLKLPSL